MVEAFEGTGRDQDDAPRDHLVHDRSLVRRRHCDRGAGMVSEDNHSAIENAKLTYFVGERIPEVAYQGRRRTG